MCRLECVGAWSTLGKSKGSSCTPLLHGRYSQASWYSRDVGLAKHGTERESDRHGQSERKKREEEGGEEASAEGRKRGSKGGCWKRAREDGLYTLRVEGDGI